MKKSYFVVSIIILFVSLSFAFIKPDEPPRYTNLKILPKDITKPVLDSIMKSFARSLGVKCDYCHAKKVGEKGLDFASDKEEAKSTARGMMRMQAKINKKYFDVKNARQLTAKLEVNCYTCHRGQGEPATKLPPLPPGSPGGPGGQGPRPAGSPDSSPAPLSRPTN